MKSSTAAPIIRALSAIWRGKPTSVDEARAWWESVAGRTAVLHSGLCVIDTTSGQRAGAVASTIIRYGTPTVVEMDAYLATEEPLEVAGGFTIDGATPGMPRKTPRRVNPGKLSINMRV